MYADCLRIVAHAVNLQSSGITTLSTEVVLDSGTVPVRVTAISLTLRKNANNSVSSPKEEVNIIIINTNYKCLLLESNN